MLYYYIISIEPQNDEDGNEYQSAAYYAAQFDNEQFEYERPYSNFISLQHFRSKNFDYPIDSRNPHALLTIDYNESTNEYTATNLYMINSLHEEKEHEFTPPIVLPDLNLKQTEEMTQDESEELSSRHSLSGYYETEATNCVLEHPNGANSTEQPTKENEDEPCFSF